MSQLLKSLKPPCIIYREFIQITQNPSNMSHNTKHISQTRLRVLGNRVPRKIFGLQREKITGDWRQLENERFNNLHSSSNIIYVIKSGKTKWAWNLACLGHKWIQGQLKTKDHFEDIGVDGRMTLQ